ncbi:MAG: hypothetical protein IIZ66_09275, partial [Clostridia bacterium]|nr:hypothetical protein [Clostridia bacterium]
MKSGCALMKSFASLTNEAKSPNTQSAPKERLHQRSVFISSLACQGDFIRTKKAPWSTTTMLFG